MVKFRLFLIAPFTLLIHSISTAQAPSWYKVFEGTIDKFPMTMHLHKKGHIYSGYYYYNSQQKPIDFEGDDTSYSGGNIKLWAYLPAKEVTETFVFAIKGKSASGEWNVGDKNALLFSAKESDPPLAFDYVFTEGKRSLRPKLKDSPMATFEAASIWPKDSSTRAIFLKQLIRKEFGGDSSTEDIGKLLLQQKKAFFEDYVDEFKDVKDEEMKEAMPFDKDASVNLTIAYMTPKLIVLAQYSYLYGGGAHGMYGTSYTCVDLMRNKLLSINDIISPAGQANLPKLLEKSFRKQYGLKGTDSLTDEGDLFVSKIEPNSNFSVTTKGIEYCYNPYEIGPYAMGEIKIFISFADLIDYLQPAFKILIQ